MMSFAIFRFVSDWSTTVTVQSRVTTQLKKVLTRHNKVEIGENNYEIKVKKTTKCATKQ